MILKEYRLPIPLTVDEYQVGQLYATAYSSLEETGGGEGVEVVSNKSFDVDDPACDFKPEPLLLDGNTKYRKGQYTHKIFHIESKLPKILRMVAPHGSLQFHEKAWSAYPYCRTILTNPNFMKDSFKIVIESMHVDRYTDIENIHQLSKEELSMRHVVYIDLSDKSLYSRNDKYNVTKPFSEKVVRGPLSKKEWWKDPNHEYPVMCAYKLITVEFKWFGLQSVVESYIQKQEPGILQGFQRRVLFWIDRWIEMSMNDIRILEDEIKCKLDQERECGSKKIGTYHYEM